MMSVDAVLVCFASLWVVARGWEVECGYQTLEVCGQLSLGFVGGEWVTLPATQLGGCDSPGENGIVDSCTALKVAARGMDMNGVDKGPVGVKQDGEFWFKGCDSLLDSEW